MWLAVIIREDDDGGLLRRKASRGGLTDEEIRMWLVHFAAKLQISTKMIGQKSVASARTSSKGLSLPAAASSMSRTALTSEDAVIASLKESFGMKHNSSPLAARPLKSPYVRRKEIESESLSEQLIRDESTSATAFFLGADLGQMLNP